MTGRKTVLGAGADQLEALVHNAWVYRRAAPDHLDAGRRRQPSPVHLLEHRLRGRLGRFVQQLLVAAVVIAVHVHVVGQQWQIFNPDLATERRGRLDRPVRCWAA